MSLVTADGRGATAHLPPPEDAAAGSPGAALSHLRALDGLRGLAVAAVVAYHVAPGVLPGGFLGVDLFFVLSGFLITSLLVSEARATGGVRWGRFAARRVRRLAPALLLVVAFLAVYARLWADPIEVARIREHGLWTLGYLANWRFVADGTTYTDLVAGASPLRHAWSLAIEEQFYLVFPIVVLALGTLVRWRNVRLRRALVVVGVLGPIASAVAMGALFDPAGDTARVYFGTDTRVQGLLVGVVLGVLLVGRPPVTGRAGRVASVAAPLGVALLIVAMAIAHEADAWLYRGGFLLVAVAAAAVVAGVQRVGWLRRSLGWRPLVGLGLISYGVYLWHWPLVVILDQSRTGLDGPALAALRLAATLAAALASFFVVERPVRSGALARLLGPWALVTAPAAIGVLALVLVLGTPAPHAPSLTPVASVAEVAAGHAASGDPGAAVGASTTAATRRVVMFGDSVAHTLAGGAVGEFPKFTPWAPDQSPFDPARIDLVSLGKPACSFLPGRSAVTSNGARRSSADLSSFCGDWRAELDTSTGDGSVIVVALANDVADRVDASGHAVRFGTPEHDRLITDLLDEVRSTAARHHADLVLLGLPARQGKSTENDNEGGWRDRSLTRFEADYAATHPDVRTIDLGTVVCPADDCGDPVDGFRSEWRYDGLHYTADGARWVAAWLTPQLQATS